jgi:hypothetical protein
MRVVLAHRVVLVLLLAVVLISLIAVVLLVLVVVPILLVAEVLAPRAVRVVVLVMLGRKQRVTM